MASAPPADNASSPAVASVATQQPLGDAWKAVGSPGEAVGGAEGCEASTMMGDASLAAEKAKTASNTAAMGPVDDSVMALRKLTLFLLKGWTVTGNECPKCKVIPLIGWGRDPRAVCVTCDDPPLVEPGSIWDISNAPSRTSFGGLNMDTLGSATLTGVPSIVGFPPPWRLASSTSGNLNAQVLNVRQCSKSGDMGRTINLTGDDAEGLSFMHGLGSNARLESKENSSRMLYADDFLTKGLNASTVHDPSLSPMFATSLSPASASVAPFGGGGLRQNLLMPRNVAASDSNLAAAFDALDREPKLQRQGAMPLHLLMASRAVSEASGMLGSINFYPPKPPVPERPASVLSALEKAQCALSEVVEQLTLRVRTLSQSDQPGHIARLMETLDALSKALDVINRMDRVRDYPEASAPPSPTTAGLYPTWNPLGKATAAASRKLSMPYDMSNPQDSALLASQHRGPPQHPLLLPPVKKS